MSQDILKPAANIEWTSSHYIFQADSHPVSAAKDRHTCLAVSQPPKEDLQPAICAAKSRATLAFLGQIWVNRSRPLCAVDIQSLSCRAVLWTGVIKWAGLANYLFQAHDCKSENAAVVVCGGEMKYMEVCLLPVSCKFKDAKWNVNRNSWIIDMVLKSCQHLNSLPEDHHSLCLCSAGQFWKMVTYKWPFIDEWKSTRHITVQSN